MRLLMFCLFSIVFSHWTDDLDLPRELLEYTVRNSPDLRKKCEEDPHCPIQRDVLSNGRCWGHEEGCPFERSYSANRISCTLPVQKGRIQSREVQQEHFFDQADWGYLRGHGRSERHQICESSDQEGTRLVCSDHLAHCTAENIFFDFSNLNARHSKRYRDDVIQPGQVGGNCGKFNKQLLDAHTDRQSYLQSWGAEFKHFESSPSFVVDDDNCDVIFERPTIVIKLDASINMFHHFCVFINLYASQHINGSIFDTDVDILWWDTFSNGFVDPYFKPAWAAFSRHTPVELTSLDGKRVCFRKALLPLLARQRYGMYYNMPMTDGCTGSGLMQAFSHHMLHRLRVLQRGPLVDKIRVTILSRSTMHRRIINEKELFSRLQSMEGVEARIVDYNGKVPFLDQLEQTHNSDIFIGMHGSGLTHLLFLPDWAAIFEIYNCEDESCYYDLARLRGVRYKTWSNMSLLTRHGEGRHPHNGTPHAKFTDYSFDVDEFERIVGQLISHVKRHPQFVEERRKMRRKSSGTKQEL
ncbi:hypothetical protein PMAYCL1PPCAC_18993 [Pristionchus mayeri]|uniref:EGF domain-specific O-linked N-acetylglucosamine transferase n=1 Tax=Pristionchus mayeri TaxID=1317129 RepID=A0AAN5CQH7_9BILA|nr:hypothetical protein PMAYCL1PPCAC_18993 [Pristionchus mayeri]